MTRRQARSDVTTSDVTPGAAGEAPPSRRPRRRAAALAAIAVAGSLTLGACQWSSPIQTESQYAPADGWSTDVGSLSLRNVLVVADKKGGPGNVVGLAVNSGTAPIDVTVSGADGAKFTVAPNGTEQFTTQGGRTTTLASVDAAPGALTTLHIGTSAGNTDLQVPVVAPTTYYSTLAPTASSSTSTATPAGSATDSPTGTTTGSAPSTAPAGTDTMSPGTTGTNGNG